MAAKATAEKQNNNTNEELVKLILEKANELSPADRRVVIHELGLVEITGIDVATLGITGDLKHLLTKNSWKGKVYAVTGLVARGVAIFIGGRWVYGKVFG